jgi:phosphoribosylcarboxyaminoimidazole (NCAIR) mutase
MNEGAVAAQVEVPVVGVDRQSLLVNPMEELLEVVRVAIRR